VMLARISASDITEDKPVAPPAAFKAPVPPPSVASKDTPAKSDKKLDQLWLSSVFIYCYYTTLI